MLQQEAQRLQSYGHGRAPGALPKACGLKELGLHGEVVGKGLGTLAGTWALLHGLVLDDGGTLAARRHCARAVQMLVGACTLQLGTCYVTHMIDLFLSGYNACTVAEISVRTGPDRNMPS